MSGHVRDSVVRRALARMPADRCGVFERSNHPLKTHHRFVNEIFISALHLGDPGPDIPDKDINELLKMPSLMAELAVALPLIDRILFLYAKHRGLI